MTFRFSIGLVAGSWLVVTLIGCTPKGDLVGETHCRAAIARATQSWRVTYFSQRTHMNPDNVRIEEFAKAELLNRNGEKPSQPASGPNEYGVWFPPVPPQPSEGELTKIRQSGERFDSPELHREVKYTLVCDGGELAADGNIYRDAANVIQAGQVIQVSYSLGRVLGTIPPSADTAQGAGSPSPEASQPSPGTQAGTSAGIVYVDPQTGKDEGNGSQEQPLKTITYAIAQAPPGSTIQLRPGSYSGDTGEIFPLRLKAGMTLRGDPQTQGKGIQISGGGKFLSPTWAGQSVTILTEKDCQISGVRVTNPNSRGTGVWVEAGNPVIAQNQFIGSDREGVFVSGSATPTIRNNLFEQNGGNGLAFTRDSGGTAEDNIIRVNGFGIAISERSSPSLVNNLITQSKDGLVITGDAAPTLRGNRIEENGRDGIVVTMNAKPTLNQNTLRENGQYDLHNVSSQPLKLTTGELAGLKVEGKVN